VKKRNVPGALQRSGPPPAGKEGASVRDRLQKIGGRKRANPGGLAGLGRQRKKKALAALKVGRNLGKSLCAPQGNIDLNKKGGRYL